MGQIATPQTQLIINQHATDTMEQCDAWPSDKADKATVRYKVVPGTSMAGHPLLNTRITQCDTASVLHRHKISQEQIFKNVYAAEGSHATRVANRHICQNTGCKPRWQQVVVPGISLVCQPLLNTPQH
jgi:hypothetical protein